MRKFVATSIWLCVAPLILAAQESEFKVPAEVAPFVESGTKAIALERGDLNGDKREDFILVLEKENPAKDDDDFPVNQRPLLILLRGADGKLTDGKLTSAKRNERIIMCSKCGGVFGDPLEGVVAGRNTFSVEHYGGSNWRWKYSYKFNYSRIDKTWQLVCVEELSYHTSDPNKVKAKIYTPPRYFGKIDIADFDPENYVEKAVKRKTGNRLIFSVHETRPQMGLILLLLRVSCPTVSTRYARHNIALNRTRHQRGFCSRRFQRAG